MFKKAFKKVVFAVIVINLLLTQINMASAQGVLLINSDIIQNENRLVIGADDTDGDITLQFGTTLNEYLKWDSVGEAFSFSDDLDLQDNELKNFRIDNQAAAPICDSTVKGKVYHNTTDTYSYICNGTQWVQIDGGGGGAGDTLAAVQARRSTSFTLTNQDQWYDIPFDNLDVQTDSSVLEQDTINSERINIKADGTYMVSYIIDAVTASNTHEVQARVLINGTTRINGSYMESYNYSSEHSPTTGTFLANLNSGDYITLQVVRMTTNDLVGEPVLTITKLDGVKGDKGDPGSVGTGTDSESWIIDEDGTGGDLELYFGSTLTKYLQWNSTAGAFILNDDLLLNFNELKQFKVENSNTPLTCSGGYTGRLYYDTNDNHTYVCDGSIWQQIDGGGSSSVFGTEYDYASNDSVSITTSTTYQQKLTLTTGDLPSGNYKISWSYQWNHNSTADGFEAQVQQDNTTEVMHHQQEPQDSGGTFGSTGTDQQHLASGFKIVNLSGVHTFDLDYRTNVAGVNSSIWNARLEIFRVE